MHATQGKLVTLHNDDKRLQPGAGPEGGKVCFVPCMLLCMASHSEYVGQNLTRREGH